MEFRVPELGEGVHEGELVKWLVKVGDAVVDDQPICEVMTDKATVEIPAPFSGTITSIDAKEGQTVKVNQVLVTYDSGAGATKAPNGAAAKAPALAKPSAPAATPAATAKPAAAPAPAAPSRPAPSAMSMGALQTDPATRALAAPSTRRFARESGVAVDRVPGTGPNGRILREDIERFLKGGTGGVARAPSGPAETREPFKGLRKKISEKMRQSKDHAAHFTYVEEADVTQLVKLRNVAKEIAAAQGIKLTYLPFLMKAMAVAIKKYPILNSSLDEEKAEIVYKNYVNVSLSVQTDDGLMAPVIKGVDHKSILEIAQDIQAVVERARAKKLTQDDLKGGSITLTNAGTIGGLFATPVINYPEVAILGFNKIARKPVVKTIRGRERIVIRDWTYFSISLDHRIVDGAIGAEFMKLFISYVENPALLLLTQ